MIEHVTSDCVCPGKLCPRCKEVKCHGSFARLSTSKDGLQWCCRVCRSKIQKAYYDAHQEQISERWKERHSSEAAREIVRERSRVYREQKKAIDPDFIKRKSKTWRQNHAEYYQAQNQARARAYREANLEKAREQSRIRSQKIRRDKPGRDTVYQHTRRSRKVQSGGKFTPQQWSELKAYYNYTCLCCGKREPEIKLTIDHVIPISLGGTNFIDNIQPLCSFCNKSKHAKIIDYRPNREQQDA